MTSFQPSFKAGFQGGKPSLKAGLLNRGSLVKAQLIPWDRGVPKIEFMFNPAELTFDAQVNVQSAEGSQTQTSGETKVNFSLIKSYKVSMSKVTFDTYEAGENVVDQYLKAFKAALRFVGSDDDEDSSMFGIQGLPEPVKGALASPLSDASKSAESGLAKVGQATGISKVAQGIEKGLDQLFGDLDKKRTPIYRFVWGEQVYLRRCFVEKFTYRLTMFLPDGTPVRAVIDNLTLTQADSIKSGNMLGAAIVNRVSDTMAARLQGGFKL